MTSLLTRLRRLSRPGIVREVAGRGATQHALMLYATSAFRPGFENARHQNVQQQRELATALGERGYAVDVVDYDEKRSRLFDRNYDLVIDLHPVAHPVYADRLNQGAVRIAYITGTNPAVANAAEQSRGAGIQQRRGVRLRPRRQQPLFPPAAMESFDAMFLIGNDVTLGSYREFRLHSVHLLPNTGWDELQPTPAEQREARRFMYLGSVGQVHKGLDLLLELFAAERSLELIVCGDFRRERDFARCYRRELFRTPNIRAAGWVDLRSPEFRELQAGCGAMLLPSCAEGQAGTVTLALAFGMPCGVSRECGFSDEDLTLFPDCSPSALRGQVLQLAARTPDEVARAAAASLALYRKRYRHEHYAVAVRAALDAVLAAKRPRDAGAMLESGAPEGKGGAR